MRWDSLRLDSSDARDPAGGTTLPLIERNAVARTFDTPEFRGMTFYEIHAKSIVSEVPKSSRMMFRYTINPYRGCQHACSYCLPGETPILRADGTAKSLADVRVGDAIYGTVRDGFYRRYVTTEVLAHWSTVKPAYRVTLEDGTKLITSGDHRFLTQRGWKHVTGAEQGPDQRPFLTTNNKLMGFGGFADPPKESIAYRRGYLCGIIRGDGTPGRYSTARGDVSHFFRLALTDHEGLARARDYLATFAVLTRESDFSAGKWSRRPLRAIFATSRSSFESIAHQIRWPNFPCRDWFCGFLAGIFDAEGSYSQKGIWRISNTDPEIIAWISRSLRELGFEHVLEPTNRANGLVVVRLRGGLKEVMRFFHTTDPAITRKRSIEGMALKSDANLRVAAIEPLGLELPMYDITTGTGDFIANGVVSHNCFARNTHTYLDLDAGHDFDSKVVVKVNAPELTRAKLASPSWAGEHIAMGTNVDPYQRAEGRYKLTRGIIEALRDAANPFSILTKGTLITRDLDLLRSAAEVTDVGLNVSAAFVDKSLWRAIEPGTPAPERRIEACAALNDAGLRCGVLMGPVVPYLSDSPAQLAATVRQAAEAGAVHVTPIVLHLRPGAREWFLGWLREAHPELVPRYAELYGRGAYARKDYQARIAGRVRDLAERFGVGRGADRPDGGTPRGRGTPASAARPPATAHEQLSLL
ncbi:MAG TPA: intein-containing Rv2578c family radical SAM protein [Trebonia sp.]|nr:intein-containing Rv2578c family radical SAM protein [Trebonia sp.]